MRTKSDYEKKRRKRVAFGGASSSLEKKRAPKETHTHTRFFLPLCSTSDKIPRARKKRVPPIKRFFTTSRDKESSDCGAFAATERKDAKVESLSLSLSLSLLVETDRA